MTVEATPTSTAHTAAVRHETHAENHLQRINTKVLTARHLGNVKELAAAVRRLNHAQVARRDALRQLDELEHRQAQRRQPHGGAT